MKFSTYLFASLLVPIYGQLSAHQQPDMFKHYATHIATDIGSRVAAVATILTGALTASAFDQKQPVGQLLGSTAILTGLAAGFYTIYKAPQWTDKYILDYKNERNGGQNLLTFVCRIFLPVPLGTILGELGIENELASA